MTMGYCPYCQKNVYMKKEDFKVGLAILLLVFTAGFGLFIYLMIYLDKQPNRCIYCGTKCQELLLSSSPSAPENSESVKSAPYQKVSITTAQTDFPKKQVLLQEEARFCMNCGAELENNVDQRYCPACGKKIHD